MEEIKPVYNEFEKGKKRLEEKEDQIKAVGGNLEALALLVSDIFEIVQI